MPYRYFRAFRFAWVIASYLFVVLDYSVYFPALLDYLKYFPRKLINAALGTPVIMSSRVKTSWGGTNQLEYEQPWRTQKRKQFWAAHKFNWINYQRGPKYLS